MKLDVNPFPTNESNQEQYNFELLLSSFGLYDFDTIAMWSAKLHSGNNGSGNHTNI
ncbi:hypothetical protein GYB57_05000 [bacterium]|nr:hypothetical protein [bacterium]